MKIHVNELVKLLERGGVPLTDERLRQLGQDGWFPKANRGTYDAIPVLLGLAKYYRELRTTQNLDLESERLRKTTEEADKLALENEKTRGALVEIEAVYKNGESIFVALRARILASGLADVEKDELLKDLQQLTASAWESKSTMVVVTSAPTPA